MKVPYVDLVAQNAAVRDELLDAVGRVLDHGQLILGREVAAFEEELAAYLGVPHVVGVSNGTDALVLALRLAGVGPGDEVLTVSHSFVATASSIALVGATPVFVDIEESSMLMDPDRLAPSRTPRTRAVMPVHLNGSLCDMDAILEFCRAQGLALIEDAAQAIGARTVSGAAAGSFGIGAFSLHPLKILGATGDAGFVAVRDEAAADRLRRTRNLGLRDRDHCMEAAPNHRLDAIHAAMLRVKLRRLDEALAARQDHAVAYRQAFAGRLTLPPAGTYSAFVVRHPQRDAVLEAIRRRGVDAKVHYPLAIHQQPAFLGTERAPLPVTERVVTEMLSLPVSAELSAEDRSFVISTVLDALDEVES